MQEFSTTIKEIRYLTQDVIQLTVGLVSPDEITYDAGQYMEFRFPQGRRYYSIVSVPSKAPSLDFCIELFPHGVSSAFFKNAKVGDTIGMSGPMGIMTVKDFSRDVFFVATGVGVAPFASIIPDILGKGFANNIHLLFGVGNEENVFFFDRFNHLQNIYKNFKFTPILSRPKSHWPGEMGRVTTYIDVAFEYYKKSIFYVCGNMDMVNEVRRILFKKGLNNKDIKLEIFN